MKPFSVPCSRTVLVHIVEKGPGSKGCEHPGVTQRTLAGCDAVPVPAGATLRKPTV